MFEKVNPGHPDKVADRIAGALVDLAYKKAKAPKIAVEVLIGHGRCFIICETSEHFFLPEVKNIVRRISGITEVDFTEVKQDRILSDNQSQKIKCGDNGIFRGAPVTKEQAELTQKAREIYERYECDGKYISDGESLIICQSNVESEELERAYPGAKVNPLGYWTGGLDVDSGATNRKLGSDMGDAVTGGGLHGKDLSKADVSVNIYAHLMAQIKGEPVEYSCAIGDEEIDGKPYSDIVKIAGDYIELFGGFEKFAEWGLIR